jgi:ribosomal-protein-alanine N-acetyltransferase
MQECITTRRLFLDMLTTADYQFIISLVNSKGWIEFIGNRNVHSKEDAITYINKILTSKNIFYWVVRMKEGNIPIGIISLLKREYLENFDIGFAFLPEFYGCGYAYEAAREILSMLSESQEYSKILAITIPGNVTSIKLLVKLGFHFEKEIETGNEKLYLYSNSAEPQTIM